jgi:transposase InsO family protein
MNYCPGIGESSKTWRPARREDQKDAGLGGWLQRERIRRKVYKTRAEARQDVFEYIEMFYNPKRKHVRNGMLSPVEFERQQKISSEGV